MSLPPESPRHKLNRCLAECREYIDMVESSADPELAELVSAAIWDAKLEIEMRRRTPAPREYPAEAYMISHDLAESLARGDCRKVGG